MGDRPIEALYEQVRKLTPAAADDEPAKIAIVAPGIRVLALKTPTLPPATRTNVYLVGPDRGLLAVVDPGSPDAAEQAVLDSVIEADGERGCTPALVLLTHHHGDHVGGAAAFAARWQVPIAAHAATARRLAGVVDVDRELADGERVELGDVAVECVHTPGHAEGHLCFELASAGATIVGDMVAGIGTILIDPSEGDMGEYIASLQRLLARPQQALLPAHGPVIADGHRKLREYLAHRAMREQLAVAALARHPGGAELDTLVPEVYADTPAVLWPLAARSLLAHLLKLARDGRARDLGRQRWAPMA
jgi:ribonuclease/clavin/mitogillin